MDHESPNFFSSILFVYYDKKLYICRQKGYTINYKMKKILFALVLLWMGNWSYAQTFKEYFVTDNPIIFDDTQFYFGWSANPTKGYFLHEYFPKGETPEHFNKMFTVNIVETNIMAKGAAVAKVNELTKRKETDDICNYNVYENGDEYLVDFLVSDMANGQLTTVEWNIHYYKDIEIDSKHYTQLVFFSQRAYGDDIIPFIKSLPNIKSEKILALAKIGLEVKTLK